MLQNTKLLEKIVVSYNMYYDKEGTVYRQQLRMSGYNFLSIDEAIREEIRTNYPNKDKYSFTSGYERYLQPIRIKDNKGYSNWRYFINLTTLRFINFYLGRSFKVDRNTCVYVDSKMCSFN